MSIAPTIITRSVLAACAAALSLAAADTAKITVTVDGRGHPIPPTLWGIFFEDINLSADGGIYPELVRNRSFEDSPHPEYWSLISSAGADAAFAISDENPLNPLNRRHLQVDVRHPGASGVSVVNDGYWGMAVEADATYRFSVATRASGGLVNQSLVVHLERADGTALAEGKVEGLADRWRPDTIVLKSSASDPKARLRIEIRGTGTVHLDMVSLLPTSTWKGHGLRPDLCEKLDGLKPGFVRFPGGCWVEGNDLARSYRWKETIGDVAYRQPLANIWGYQATHGLGYHEYLQMCEDLGAQALFVINCGMSHTENVPLDWMGQITQDALDAIEYANGPTNSVWGAVRAHNGHSTPFNLRYLEVGNENGGPAYAERYALMVRAIKARYPEVNLVANDWGGVPMSAPVEIVDEHYYSSPEFFIEQAGRYDRYDRRGAKVYVGEYAVTQGCGQGNLRAAVGEAAFMTGMERNSDVVIMASYAPLFVNVNHRKWNPDLIGFDSARAYGIPSYFVQQMFARNRGDVTVPVMVTQTSVLPEARHGRVGLGTWDTQAEYKDLRVTRGNETLYQADFGSGDAGWKPTRGQWQAGDGLYRQTAGGENVQSHVGEVAWSDYTVEVKARKLGGAEGFLVLFNVVNEDNFTWWNVGGWGNREHALEVTQGGGKGGFGAHVPGQIETGRWYDLRIELHGQKVKCLLDGKLIHDVDYPTPRPFHVAASRDNVTGEVILKTVNAGAGPCETDVEFTGITAITGPVRATVLQSTSPLDENSIDQPTRVAPVEETVPANGAVVRHVFPGNSVSVWRVKTR